MSTSGAIGAAWYGGLLGTPFASLGGPTCGTGAPFTCPPYRGKPLRLTRPALGVCNLGPPGPRADVSTGEPSGPNGTNCRQMGFATRRPLSGAGGWGPLNINSILDTKLSRFSYRASSSSLSHFGLRCERKKPKVGRRTQHLLRNPRPGALHERRSGRLQDTRGTFKEPRTSLLKKERKTV